jgi:hypothetical protein
MRVNCPVRVGSPSAKDPSGDFAPPLFTKHGPVLVFIDNKYCAAHFSFMKKLPRSPQPFCQKSLGRF